MKLTIQDLQRFYLAKEVEPSCPVCTKENWVLAEAPDNMAWALGSASTDGSVRLPAPSIPTVVLVCDNCNFLRVHAALPIAQWIKDNPAQGEKS